MLIRGFFTGLALVAPVGPVALALIGIGIERGRQRAVAGAVGIAFADVVLLTVTAVLAVTVGLFELAFIRWVQLGLAFVLAAVGLVTIVRADGAIETLGRIERPGRTLCSMTLINPMSLAIWLGIVAALPPETFEGSSVVSFGLGIAAASLGWHLLLATLSAWIGPRLSAGLRRSFTIAGGVVLIALAALLLF